MNSLGGEYFEKCLHFMQHKLNCNVVLCEEIQNGALILAHPSFHHLQNLHFVSKASLIQYRTVHNS